MSSPHIFFIKLSKFWCEVFTIIIRYLEYRQGTRAELVLICVGLVLICVDSCRIRVESCWLVLDTCWFELESFWFVLSCVGHVLIRVDSCQNCVDCTGTRVLEQIWSFIYTSIFRYFSVSSAIVYIYIFFYF